MSQRSRVHKHVSKQRLRENITDTASFGRTTDQESGHGRAVLTGTEANEAAREYLVEELEAAGLAVRVDAVGNVVGRYMPDTADPDRAAVASGSHLDSVPVGGMFDGVLGVYAALEAVRAIQEGNICVNRPIEVVCFTEEEGSRFSDGVLGSSVATGSLDLEAALALEDDDGVSLESTLSDIGFRGEGRVDATAWDSWLELHIEQGERLDRAGVPVGVVSTITGTTRCRVSIEGEADHAGTTSMDERSDALVAASELILEVEAATRDINQADSPTAVGTVGSIDVTPNAVNVIPGVVDATLDIRDINAEAMEQIVADVRHHLDQLEAERGVKISFERPYDLEPVTMNNRCSAAIREAARDANIDYLDLHSGAGHDTMTVARVTDAGMLFAPSKDGVSHSPAEWTDWDDCAAATVVLTDALTRLASDD